MSALSSTTQRLDHHYSVFDLEDGTFVLTQIWADGDIQLLHCRTLHQCQEVGSRAGQLKAGAVDPSWHTVLVSHHIQVQQRE